MQFELSTFIFETVNFVILLWLLNRIVFKPLKEGLEKRRATALAEKAEAQKQLDDAEGLKAAIEKERQAIRDDRARLLKEAEEEAATARARLIETAREDAEAERLKGTRALELERNELLSHAKDVAFDLSVQLASTLIDDLGRAAVHDALIDRLLAEVRTLSRPQGPLTVDVTLPAERDPASDVRVREGIASVFGPDARVELVSEPRIVAGARLRAGDRVLDATLAGQLTNLRSAAERILADRAEGTHA